MIKTAFSTQSSLYSNDAVISVVTGCGHISGGKDYRGLKEEIKVGDENLLMDGGKMGVGEIYHQ